MRQQLVRICPQCQNDYNVNWPNQITCSRKCSADRRKLKDTVAAKERRNRKVDVISFPCMYKKCEVIIQRYGHVSNRKFCAEHAVIRKKEQRKTSYLKKRIYKINGDCLTCENKLTQGQKKYCSIKCRKAEMKKRLYQTRLKESLRLHERKIIMIKEKIGVC